VLLMFFKLFKIILAEVRAKGTQDTRSCASKKRQHVSFGHDGLKKPKRTEGSVEDLVTTNNKKNSLRSVN
jgi:hypothetical protein